MRRVTSSAPTRFRIARTSSSTAPTGRSPTRSPRSRSSSDRTAAWAARSRFPSCFIPRSSSFRTEEIIGAEAVHKHLRRWLAELGHRRVCRALSADRRCRRVVHARTRLGKHAPLRRLALYTKNAPQEAVMQTSAVTRPRGRLRLRVPRRVALARGGEAPHMSASRGWARARGRAHPFWSLPFIRLRRSSRATPASRRRSRAASPPARGSPASWPRSTRRRSSLITAPAGYGKTSLLAEWAQEDDRVFAWVTLGRGARGPAVPARVDRCVAGAHSGA